MHDARKHAWRTQAAWAKILCPLDQYIIKVSKPKVKRHGFLYNCIWPLTSIWCYCVIMLGIEITIKVPFWLGYVVEGGRWTSQF